MIKYTLNCNNGHQFESWFSNSASFEKLQKNKHLECTVCHSKEVEKSLMAPRLLNRSSKKMSENKISRLKKINKKIKDYQEFIRNNFEYVGENFAYEARSIHYNNKKKDKGIFGVASNDEIKELREEGIDTEVIPWIKDKNN